MMTEPPIAALNRMPVAVMIRISALRSACLPTVRHSLSPLARDYPLVQGTMLILGFTFVMINLTVDILYTLADPRVRHD